MKKLGIIMHALGLLSGIVGAYTLRDYGWIVYQWPIICCMWVIASFFGSLSAEADKRRADLLDKLCDDLHEQLAYTQIKLHEADFKRAEK